MSLRGEQVQNTVTNRLYVSTRSNFSTVKAAVDYFNTSATANTEILIDAGVHNITDTITVNNSSYSLQIRGLGSNVSKLVAATGLTNKPMFDIKTTCDINKLTLDGSTLTNYSTLSTENAINFTTTNNTYTEITDIIFNKFNIGIYDTIGTYIFTFNAEYKNMTTAGIRVNTANSNAFVDSESVTYQNCAIGIDLLKANTGGFYINTCFFLNGVGNIAIKYTGNAGNFVYTGITTISDCTYNNVGTFFSGFDFTRVDGRDANIVLINNPGSENKNPHSKINVLDNPTVTTITAVNTWYKANLTLTVKIIFDVAATAGNFTITVGGETTGNIAYNASAATIKAALEALTNITTVTVTEVVASKEWNIRYNTANEGWAVHSVNIAGLTTTTNYYILGNTYLCKWKVESNRLTWQQNNIRDVEMWVNANVLCSKNSVRVDLAIARYNSSNVLRGYYGLNTTTSTASASSNPAPCPLVAYINDVTAGDYFEIHILKPTNAGDTVTLSDISWLTESK